MFRRRPGRLMYVQFTSSVYGDLFMIILKRITSIFFSVHSWLSLKKLILDDWEKGDTYLAEKILMIKNLMQHFLFHSSRSAAVLKFLVSIKNLGQCKKFPWDKFVMKKKHFVACEIFLELQCLVDYLFLRIINVYQLLY